jgi:proteasome lid subunit RPN8/RPN11
MLTCPTEFIEQTLFHIHAGGRSNCETAVLWLGRRLNEQQEVLEVFRPQQFVDVDYFRIPAEGMRALLTHLRRHRLQILGQVHSHPKLAFHSEADNQWAIVRHVGATSLVVPWFGARTRAASFLDDIAAFKLDEHDQWLEVTARSVLRVRA